MGTIREMVHGTYVCREIEDLTKNDIYPVEHNGIEILHVHISGGAREVFSKTGTPLYYTGDVVSIVNENDEFITLMNEENDTSTQVFRIPVQQFRQDFIRAENF